MESQNYIHRSVTPGGTQVPVNLLEKSPSSLRETVIQVTRDRDAHVAEIEATTAVVAGRNMLHTHRCNRGDKDLSSDEEEGVDALAPLLTQTMADLFTQVHSKIVASNSGSTQLTAEIKGDRFIEVDKVSCKPVEDGTPQELKTLWNLKQYIPIHSFTSANQQAMKLQKINSLWSIAIDGSKKSVLNTDTFGPEDEIPQAHWLEAWRHFLEFLSPRCTDVVFASVNKYFTKLQGNSLFYEHWPAFLKFDIDIRMVQTKQALLAQVNSQQLAVQQMYSLAGTHTPHQTPHQPPSLSATALSEHLEAQLQWRHSAESTNFSGGTTEKGRLHQMHSTRPPRPHLRDEVHHQGNNNLLIVRQWRTRRPKQVSDLPMAQYPWMHQQQEQRPPPPRLFVIEEYLLEEIDAGRVSGPLTKDQVGDALKWHVIGDLSAEDEHGVSINDLLDSDLFPMECVRATH
ncbi:hypothetical protein BKA62DRAFT_780362 [Auriculariales sp. MPI-PUGE-AT-0066]|nr:hypothetical protein BKA62DRAFT_780362 [Auriculariales sp. MPI-PUGE-AT-0066]